jgi:hypothetical protein
VTGQAAALALEYGPASADVTSTAGARSRITKETEIPHNELRLAGREFRWRHGCTGNAAADDSKEFLVGISLPKLATAEVDAWYAVAFLPVAGCTIHPVKPRSLFDVSRSVAWALCEQGAGSQSQDYKPGAQKYSPSARRGDDEKAYFTQDIHFGLLRQTVYTHTAEAEWLSSALTRVRVRQ